MKTFWAWAAKICLVVLVCATWYIYNQHEEIKALSVQNKRLQIELKVSQELLATANAKVEELDKRSLEGVLRETNKVVISGWETLLDTVEQELEKAREIINDEDGGSTEPSRPLNTEPPSNHNKPKPIVEPKETLKGERT